MAVINNPILKAIYIEGRRLDKELDRRPKSLVKENKNEKK